jgi:hypothetical protein
VADEAKGGGPPADPNAVALEKMRTTTQWLMGVLGAIGASLVAGIQLGSLGSLAVDDWRWWLAIGAFVVALIGVAVILRKAAAVLAPDTTTLHQLVRPELSDDTRRLKEIVASFDEQPWMYQGWGPTLRELKDQLEKATKARHETYDDAYREMLEEAQQAVADAEEAAAASDQGVGAPGAGEAGGSAGDEDHAAVVPSRAEASKAARAVRLNVANNRFATVDAIATRTLGQAHFRRFQARFAAMMENLVWWGALTGTAIALFAWAANPPEADAGGDGSGGGAPAPAAAEEVEVALTAFGAQSVGPLLGDACDTDAVSSVVVERADDSLTVVSSPTEDCAAVRFAVTCEVGVATAEVAGTPERVGPRCS